MKLRKLSLDAYHFFKWVLPAVVDAEFFFTAACFFECPMPTTDSTLNSIITAIRMATLPCLCPVPVTDSTLHFIVFTIRMATLLYLCPVPAADSTYLRNVLASRIAATLLIGTMPLTDTTAYSNVGAPGLPAPLCLGTVSSAYTGLNCLVATSRVNAPFPCHFEDYISIFNFFSSNVANGKEKNMKITISLDLLEYLSWVLSKPRITYIAVPTSRPRIGIQQELHWLDSLSPVDIILD